MRVLRSLLLGGVAGCNGFLSPDPPFTLRLGAVSSAPQVTVDASRIYFRSSFHTLCAPHLITGTAAVADKVQLVEITITGEPVDGCPQDVVQDTRYEAAVRIRMRGTLELRVYHRWALDTDRTTVYAGTVAIP